MMTEQEKKQIIEELRSHLTGRQTEDLVYLQQQAEAYAAQDPQSEIPAEILKLAYTLLPQEQLSYLQKTMYIGERRLDQFYREAEALMQKGQTAKALTLTKQLYEHVIQQFPETDTARFFSFRNLLESNLYQLLYHPTKKLLKAPFDFTRFLTAHAYNLVEVRRTQEAIPVLKDAIRYDPVNPDPRFELAEAYKLLNDNDALLETICDTLPICTSGYAISRCYANLGFYCVNLKDYKSAVAFYYESLNFADHPAVPGELRHIEHLSGKPIVPPTREMINAAFAKYQIYHGPGKEVLYVARELAKQAQADEKRRNEAIYYLRVVTELIHDEDAERDLKALLKAAEEDHN